jgi:hypothetical protein
MYAVFWLAGEPHSLECGGPRLLFSMATFLVMQADKKRRGAALPGGVEIQPANLLTRIEK